MNNKLYIQDKIRQLDDIQIINFYSWMLKKENPKGCPGGLMEWDIACLRWYYTRCDVCELIKEIFKHENRREF